MENDILHISSIHDIHKFLGLDEPKHPLISVFNLGEKQDQLITKNITYSLGFYKISLIKNCQYTISKYGRNSYDFQECSIVFTAPNQVLQISNTHQVEDNDNWHLVFHPDLIRRSELGRRIDTYSYFNYATNEALHLSIEERNAITEIVHNIINEYSQKIDHNTQPIIISNLELLLNYAVRFYDRQFNTRTNFNKDLVSQFEEGLQLYYSSELPTELGLPNVQFFAEKMNISPRYLSDLLRRETGKGAQEHIHQFIIEKAKTMLLSTNKTASEIAYDLGFGYPQYFTKLFKRETSMNPIEYRENYN